MMPNKTIHPTVVAVVNHQKFRVLLDNRAGGSLLSSTSIKHISQKPLYWELKEMETIIMTATQKLPAYKIQQHSTDGQYSIDVKVNKLDRPVLTALTNPRITNLKRKYLYLSGLQFNNEHVKNQQPIYIILGAGDIAKIKLSGFISGKAEEPVGEKTLFGWTLMGEDSESPSQANILDKHFTR